MPLAQSPSHLSKTHRCNKCTRSFVTRAALSAHCRSTGHVFPCTATGCRRTFITSAALGAHLSSVVHTASRPTSNDTNVASGATNAALGSIQSGVIPAQTVQPLRCTVPGCNKSFKTSQSRAQHVKSAAHRKKAKATKAQNSVQAVSVTTSKPLPIIKRPIAVHCTNPVVESTTNNIRAKAPHPDTSHPTTSELNSEKFKSVGGHKKPPSATKATQESVLEIPTPPIRTPMFRWDTRWSAIPAAQYSSIERALRALVSTPAISTTLDKVFWTPDHMVAPEHDPAIQKRRAIVLDCEMVGIGPKATTSELARLSAIDWFTGELVIDALVQPDCVVTDWRTKWSGITAEIMEVAVTSGDALKGSSAARAELFKYMDSSTVLVGHALRYDLAALGIHHNVMVDSAVLAKEAVGKNVRRDWASRRCVRSFWESLYKTMEMMAMIQWRMLWQPEK